MYKKRMNVKMTKQLSKRLFLSVAGNCRPSSGITFIRLPLVKGVVLFKELL